MTTIIQEDLISGLRQADIDGPVRLLYEHYFEGIIAQVCIKGGNREDGADIFQEAVLILIDKVKSGAFRGESSIKTFLSAIARNLWLHELRTRGRRNSRELIYMNAEEREAESLPDFFKETNTNAVVNLLDQVGDPCKRILTGFYYEEKSMKEILAEFNYENEQVLRNRKSRCMKKLKELLSSDTALVNNLKTLSVYA